MNRYCRQSFACALRLVFVVTVLQLGFNTKTLALTADAGVASNSASEEIPEIIVSAQRRSENAQDVPVSVTAIAADGLESYGITNVADLKSIIPSLSVENANGYFTLHLRGVGSTSIGAGIENPVSLYVDGVYYANQTVGFAGFNNIDRIEVLKGPQGTLFGRNATGGLISVVTAEPTQNFQLRVDGRYSNYNTPQGSLYVSGGLMPDLAADIAVRASHQGQGWGVNEVNGEYVAKIYEDIAVRSKVVYSPGSLKFTLIGDFSVNNNSGPAPTLAAGTRVAPGFPVVTYRNAWDVDTNVQPEVDIKNGGVSLRAEDTFSSFSLSNLVAYRNSKFVDQFDFDGSPLPLTGVVIRQDDWQGSDELQFTSIGDRDVSWVGGLYYFHEEGSTVPSSVLFSDEPIFNPIFPATSLLSYATEKTNSVAAYGQTTWKVTDKLNLTGGARYTYERRTLEGYQNLQLDVPGDPLIPAVPLTTGELIFKDPTFRAAIDYKPANDILTYASFNTGFKSGGFNTTAPTDPAFKPEKIKAYEVGEKSEFWERKFRVNSAVFYYDYKDIQVQKQEATGSGILNGARAEIYGYDLDLTVVPISHLKVTGGLSLLHAVFENFVGAPIGSAIGGTPVTYGSVSGNTLPFAPKSTLDLGATYTAPVGMGQLVFNIFDNYNHGYFYEPDNVLQQRAYDIVNSSALYQTLDKHFSVGLFGNNVFNKAVVSLISTGAGGQHFQILSAPRIYGITFAYRY